MTVTQNNKWAIAGAMSGAALIIYSPIAFGVVDTILGSKGWIAPKHNGEWLSRAHTAAGLFLHTVVFFFVAFGIMNATWACE